MPEVLDTVRGPARLLLEVKSPHRYPGIAEILAAELDGVGRLQAGARPGRLVVQSFDWAFMAYFRTVAPDVPAGLLGRPLSVVQVAELSTW